MRLFARKKEKLPEVIAPITKPLGFFSTSVDFKESKLSAYVRVSSAMQQSFQKSAKDLQAVHADGAIAMDMAMDAVPSNIQQTKAFNNSSLFQLNIPETQLIWYAQQGFIGYQTSAMIAQNWLVDKACAMPAKDAVRHGYEITVNDGTKIDSDVLDYMIQQDKKFDIKSQCVEFINMGRVFGIRIALFVVESKDPKYYEKPFNADGVTPGSYKGITQVDPYWISPELDAESASNPASLHFYEPTWWRINGKRYHRSHLVIMRNGEVADILKPTYLYGGIPVPQKIAERVFASERCANEAPMLMMTKRLTVLNVDISQAMANEETFKGKMDLWTALMNNYGVKVVGGEEKIEQFDTALADVDSVIMTQYQLVAAASGVPVTKLLGTTPKGFNATGEYDESSYHEELESIQEHELSPLVDRHHLLLIRSEVTPKFKVKFETSIVWKPTDSPTAAELADLNLKKSQNDSALVTAGAIDGYDVRQRIINDSDSGYNGIEDVVEDGPGDREAQQQAEGPLEQAAQASNKAKPGEGKDYALDISDWNAKAGTLNGARIITQQRFLDEKKVEEKIKNEDYIVNVTPEFVDSGKKYRMVIDGHHSLAAAMRANVDPLFLESVPREEVFNAATRQATDAKTSN